MTGRQATVLVIVAVVAILVAYAVVYQMVFAGGDRDGTALRHPRRDR